MKSNRTRTPRVRTGRKIGVAAVERMRSVIEQGAQDLMDHFSGVSEPQTIALKNHWPSAEPGSLVIRCTPKAIIPLRAYAR